MHNNIKKKNLRNLEEKKLLKTIMDRRKVKSNWILVTIGEFKFGRFESWIEL